MAKTKKAAKAAGKIKIKMIGSVIGCPRKQRATVRGLGLRRLHQVVERLDTPEIRGMAKKIPHLVVIIEQEGAASHPPDAPRPRRQSESVAAASGG